MASIEATSQRAFNATGELRPQAGFAACMAFDSDHSVSRQMQGAYEAIMPALYFGAEPLPTWAEICARVHDRRRLL